MIVTSKVMTMPRRRVGKNLAGGLEDHQRPVAVIGKAAAHVISLAVDIGPGRIYDAALQHGAATQCAEAPG